MAYRARFVFRILHETYTGSERQDSFHNAYRNGTLPTFHVWVNFAELIKKVVGNDGNLSVHFDNMRKIGEN